MGITKKLTKI